MEDKKQTLINIESIDLSILKSVPLSFSKNNKILPVKKENGELKAFVGSMQGVFALKELARQMGLTAHPIMIDENYLIEITNNTYGKIGSAEEVMGDISDQDLTSVATEFESPKDLLELTEDAPIIRLLNILLQQAVKENASDIHIEPYEKDMTVRMRIDGMLKKVLNPPKIIQDAIISRIKIMANLDIAEKRLPQDGRIRLLIGGQDIDVRVSIIPSVYGERAVLRLLDRKRGLIGLDELGMNEEIINKFKKILTSTNGVILVTGPTGSGKTTTLYGAINNIYSVEKNIVTIEDPVEYQIKGIGQININSKIGLTFASGLRSILRHDPDVIMVGEIRDFETAEIAVQASLTGHLVLSTLHTNDAASAVTRLIDMGIEPFLLASSLIGVLAQRLIRKICANCKTTEPTINIIAGYMLAERIRDLSSSAVSRNSARFSSTSPRLPLVSEACTILI
ncbi:general secretory pathway protein E [Candidatus Magnetoovum chiemensis]|nr:general secretory pathway protein E [Candidatus Magnetoovum chiemensis]